MTPTTTGTREPIAVLMSDAGERCEFFLVQGRAAADFPAEISSTDWTVVEQYTPPIHETTGYAYSAGAPAREYIALRKSTLMAEGWRETP